MVAVVLSKLSVMNRREFIKSLIGTGVYSILPASLSQGLQYDDKGSDFASLLNELTVESSREKRIFCQIEHMSLESEIEECAQQIGCEILYGAPFSPDLLALGGFIYILDRNFVGKFWWNEFVLLCDEYKWKEPCILVDTIKDLKTPKTNLVRQIDITDALSTENILHVIKETRAQNIIKNRLLNIKT
jgi:hypothetical protein